jgi:hypothetical protein
MMAAETVTANASVGGDSAVTSNDCPKCASGEHTSCGWCRACPREPRILHRFGPIGPDGHLTRVDQVIRARPPRGDRQYCSSTCRVRAWQYRHTPEAIAEREAWEAANGARLREIGESLRAIFGSADPVLPFTDEELLALDVPAQRRAGTWHDDMTDTDRDRWKAARRMLDRLALTAARTADMCGTCGARLYPSETVYRASGQPTWQPGGRGIVFPSCHDCRCRYRDHTKNARFCEECRWSAYTWVNWLPERTYCKNSGPDHGGPYCYVCAPYAWHPARPCEGCARPVVNHKSVRPGYRRENGWIQTEDYAPRDSWRIFCSERCRRAVFGAEQKAKREHDPIDCPVCHERVDARRRDARYCSSACRQRAYRERRA